MQLIESLKWRYATKKFNRAKKVGDSDIDLLKEVVRLSASSYGLQPFKVNIVENELVKAKLQPASYGQSQIVDCSHLFVFAHLTKVQPEYVDNYIDLVSSERAIERAKLEGYNSFMKRTLSSLSDSEVRNWASKQAYIAMTNLLTACAELKIDACPIEGFEAQVYNEILQFDKIDLSACVLVAIGYRADDDPNQNLAKVRLRNQDLFL